MVNAAEAEDSSQVIMGNLLVNSIPAKVLLTLVHRIVLCLARSLQSMSSLVKICLDLY